LPGLPNKNRFTPCPAIGFRLLFSRTCLYSNNPNLNDTMKLSLGKLLFPKLAPDLRRRRMGTIYLTVFTCAVIGMAVAFLIKKMSAR
jgi:hypothetical protein